MTTSRVVRGTKIRIFVCFCAVVVILGLVACYNNTVSQLDESLKSLELCHRQQENLSAQLQVISDYKLRLEKALKTEKAEHNRSNNTYNEAVKEEKIKNEKSSLDANLRFNSLQQRYNLLQTEHDDYKEKMTKSHQDQMDEINELHVKWKDIQEELKTVLKSKEKLKNEYLNLQIENDNFKRQLEGREQLSVGNENRTNFLEKQNIELRREIESLKDKYGDHGDTIQQHMVLKEKNKDQDEPQNVLVLPNNDANNIKSSSTASSAKQSSQGSLNGARPLALPTMTPKNKANPNKNKIPEDVLPVPKVSADKIVEDNEIPNDVIDNRYKNKIEQVKERKHEELEKENGANEVFEQPNLDDGLGFGDPIKQAEKQNFNRKHIDNLAIYKEGAAKNDAVIGGDYKEGPNDQLEENVGMDEGEDDDQDEYGDHLAKHKEPAVRN